MSGDKEVGGWASSDNSESPPVLAKDLLGRIFRKEGCKALGDADIKLADWALL